MEVNFKGRGLDKNFKNKRFVSLFEWALNVWKRRVNKLQEWGHFEHIEVVPEKYVITNFLQYLQFSSPHMPKHLNFTQELTQVFFSQTKNLVRQLILIGNIVRYIILYLHIYTYLYTYKCFPYDFTGEIWLPLYSRNVPYVLLQ